MLLYFSKTICTVVVAIQFHFSCIEIEWFSRTLWFDWNVLPSHFRIANIEKWLLSNFLLQVIFWFIYTNKLCLENSIWVLWFGIGRHVVKIILLLSSCKTFWNGIEFVLILWCWFCSILKLLEWPSRSILKNNKNCFLKYKTNMKILGG